MYHYVVYVANPLNLHIILSDISKQIKVVAQPIIDLHQHEYEHQPSTWTNINERINILVSSGVVYTEVNVDILMCKTYHVSVCE